MLKKVIFIMTLLIVCQFPLQSQEVLNGGIIDKNVNGNDEDYNSFIVNGIFSDTLFFTTSRITGNEKIKKSLNAEIYYSTRPISIRLNNGKANEGWSVANKLVISDEKLAGFTRGSQALGNDRIIFAAERDLGSGNIQGTSFLLDLWQALKTGDTYSSPETLTNVNDPEAWDSQPALSSDGKVLFFVSNRAGGVGGLDLWYSVRDENGIWGKANLVPNINTKGDEISPHCGADGKFYFSSNWDFSQNTKMDNKDIYRADYKLQQGILFPVNPVNLDVSIQNEAAKYNLKIPENLKYNSKYDDEFPFITNDRASIYLTSNRESNYGKRNIYGFSLPKSKIKVLVRVSEQIFDARDSLLIPPTYKVGLPLTIIDSASNISQEIKSGEIYEVEPDRTYFVHFTKFVEEECYKNKIEDKSKIKNNTIYTIKPFGMDTLFEKDFLISRKKVEIPPIIFQATEKIPFFVTGYWYPNTTKNLKTYRERESSGFFDQSGFVDSTGYDYDINSRMIDSIFQEKLYSPMEKIMPIFQEFCRDTLYLKATVHGYTDPRGLSGGEDHPYRPASKYKHNYNDETVTIGKDERGSEVTITKGIDMWKQGWPIKTNEPNGKWVKLQDEGQNGNIILSKLRSYFTFKTFDEEMTRRSPIYRQLRDNKRIILDAEGFGIDKAGFEKRKLKDDPESRRIEIYLDILRPEEIEGHKRLANGVLNTSNLKNEINQIETKDLNKSDKLMDTLKTVEKINDKSLQTNKIQNEQVINKSLDNEKNIKNDTIQTNGNSNQAENKSLQGCYQIQYFSYLNESDAVNAATILRDNGINDAEVVIFSSNNGKLSYRLRSGCFQTAEEALLEINNQKQIYKLLNIPTKPIIVR